MSTSRGIENAKRNDAELRSHPLECKQLKSDGPKAWSRTHSADRLATERKGKLGTHAGPRAHGAPRGQQTRGGARSLNQPADGPAPRGQITADTPGAEVRLEGQQDTMYINF